MPSAIAPSPAPDLNTFTNYEYDVDLNGDNAAAKVIALVGEKRRVLEIGAGSGSISKHLVRMNQCEVTAIEINPASIEKLKGFCKAVFSCDLNDRGWPSALAAEGKFDAVVAADVLEHVYDPWSVLKEMKGLLNDGGFVVLSVPHVGHCVIQACLLAEDFEYREWGLLDKTHIRFFGVHNIQTLYESAGLAIVDARYVVKRPDQTEFSERWSRLPADMQRALTRNPFAYVYQVVTKAVPSERAFNPIRLAQTPPPPPPPPPPLNSISLRRRISRFIRGKK